MFFNANRAKVQSVLQMDFSECGAACLTMILNYYGSWQPLEKLREECNTSRDGVNAKVIIEVAKSYHLKARAFSLDLHELKDFLFPAILFWSFNHFVVLEGFTRGGAIINDPARGRVLVSEEELNKEFTGVAIAFEPMDDFKKSGQAPSLLRALYNRVQYSKDIYYYVVILSVCLTVPGILFSSFSKIFIDYYLVKQYSSWLIPIIVGVMCAALIKILFTWWQKKIVLSFYNKDSVSQSSKAFWHILHLPFRFFDQRQSSEVGSRIQLNSQVSYTLTNTMTLAFANIISMVIFFLVMLSYNIPLSFIGLTIATISFIVLSYINKKTKEANNIMLIEQGKLSSVVLSALGNLENFKATGYENVIFRNWIGQSSTIINHRQRLGKLVNITQLMSFLLNGTITAIILCLGAYWVVRGMWSIGDLIAFQLLMGFFLEPITMLVNLNNQIQQTSGSILRLEDLTKQELDPNMLKHRELRTRNDITKQKNNKQEEYLGDNAELSLGNITLDNITFGYSKTSPPLIKGLNLTINEGEKIALIGESGQGKSTLLKIIAGFEYPISGQCLFNGRPLGDIDPLLFRQGLGYLNEDPNVFYASFYDNITLWNDHLSGPDVEKAAKLANAHHFINQRPKGYDDLIIESGKSLSFGELQRVALARMFALKPRTLIFDEALSSLDNYNKLLIMKHAAEMANTFIMSTHDLALVKNFDRCIYLENGRILADGPFDQIRQTLKNKRYFAQPGQEQMKSE